MSPFAGFSDPVSSLLHLLGSALFLILGLVFASRSRGLSLGRIACVLVFLFSAVVALSLSGVFHLLSPDTAARTVMQRLDHAGIFVLIAATITSVHVLAFSDHWRWSMPLFVWSIAVTGITLKTIFFDATPEFLGLAVYLALGWLGVVSACLLYRRFGLRFIMPLIYGAIAYTAGALMDFFRIPVLLPRVLGPHELFHGLILVALAMHFRFVHRLAYRHHASRWHDVADPNPAESRSRAAAGCYAAPSSGRLTVAESAED